MIATRKTVAAPSLRVAIYARVSVSEGLEKEFNSIDAQREACTAYVASQRGSGWTAIPDSYDDGGFTGANTDRPGFQRLLADVQAGKVNVVAVYKIDRLSRSLLDFTQLLEVFRRHNVAFVSVTQSFDTSTPMGRMVVSLLATFAQFERETTSERVRDKMRATRRKGMWTGGRPPLGYDVALKKLVVNEPEAEHVRQIFTLYHELGSLLAVTRELNERQLVSKAWTSREGRHVSGRAFTKTHLHSLLTNPLYIGKVRCGQELAEGQHQPIVDQELWDSVQALLSRKAVTPRGWLPPLRNSAILRGLLQCKCGASMIHHSARRHGRVYRFYVCAKALKHGAKTCPGSRAPMGELDAYVVDRIRAVGRDSGVLRATLAADRRDRDTRRPELEAEARRLAQLRGRIESERRNVVEAIGKGASTLVDRVAELDAELADAEQRSELARRELAALELGAVDPEELRRALQDLEPVWGALVPRERARVLALLLERVIFDGESGQVEIDLRKGGPRRLAESAQLQKTTCSAAGTSPEGRQASN